MKATCKDLGICEEDDCLHCNGEPNISVYEVGEPVGIAWEPHNREFQIYDIREIRYKISGETTVEYQLARIGKTQYRTDWLTPDKLFRLNTSKFACHCTVHLYDGISTLVSRPTIVVEAENAKEAMNKVKKDLEEQYAKRTDCGLSSVTFALINKID
ncbi:hypothetical protein [Paenibacillus agaridevorans]|uniref:hypothetical protein n=1 Tax=Paenibacillus agaridevorans TaxID=171404 RepID=UPI001BE3FA56|nr:hypothetical protein [Paenibacillus agaridevorans]